MPAIYGILVAANFIACVGIWHFKQWGVQVYLISTFGKVLFYLLINQLDTSFYVGSVLSLFFSLILIRHYPKMSPNL
jgi:hypothetical protein